MGDEADGRLTCGGRLTSGRAVVAAGNWVTFGSSSGADAAVGAGFWAAAAVVSTTGCEGTIAAAARRVRSGAPCGAATVA